MRTRHVPAVLALAASAAMTVPPAIAEPITYEFSGTFSGAGGGSFPLWYDFNVPAGTALSGSFTLETDTVPSIENSEASVFRNLVTAASVSIGHGGALGSYSLGGNLLNSTDSSVLLLVDDSMFQGPIPFDQLAFAVALNPVAGDAPGLFRNFSMNSWSTTGELFTARPTISTAFSPFSAPGPFLQFQFGVASHDENGEEVSAALFADIDEVHAASVPEPGFLSLLGAGLLGALATRRRRRVANA